MVVFSPFQFIELVRFGDPRVSRASGPWNPMAWFLIDHNIAWYVDPTVGSQIQHGFGSWNLPISSDNLLDSSVARGRKWLFPFAPWKSRNWDCHFVFLGYVFNSKYGKICFLFEFSIRKLFCERDMIISPGANTARLVSPFWLQTTQL